MQITSIYPVNCFTKHELKNPASHTHKVRLNQTYDSNVNLKQQA
jgi:hypothetical protein